MAKQTNPFHGDHDDEDVVRKHDNLKKKKALTSDGDSETPISSTCVETCLPHQTSGQHELGFPDDANDILPVVNLSSTQKAQLSAPYKHSLFAKVLGKRVGDQKLQTHLRRLWSPEGELVIVPLENDFFSLRFSLPSDYNKVLEGAPWLIDDHYITLRPWIPNFKPSEAIIGQTAVWIRLPGLPIEYYVKEMLQRIGAAIGDLVRIDTVTERRTKGRFARLCVKMDLNRPLPPQIKLGGLCQRIEYEGLHVICYQCGRVGHRQQDCSYLLPVGTNRTHHHVSSQPSSELSAPQELPNTSQNLASNNSPSSSFYGPWLQVPLRRAQRPRHLAKDSAQQQPQVPNHNTAAIKSEALQLGSRFRVLEEENLVDVADEPESQKLKSSTSADEPRSPKVKSSTSADEPGPPKVKSSTSVSSPPDHTKMKAGPNNTLEQTHLQPGEGSSSAAKDTETSTQANDLPLALKKTLKPEEASTGNDPLFKPKVASGFSSSSISPETHRPNAPPLSPTSCDSNVSPLPPTTLVTGSTSTEPLSHQPTESVIINQLPTACPSFHLNQPQPSAMVIEFYSQGVQRSTQQLEIIDTSIELSTEGSPTVVSFDSKISSIDIGLNIFPLFNGMGNQHWIYFIPTVVDHTKYPVPPTCPKKLLSWNCRGAGDAKFMRAMKDLCQLHQPSIVLLFDTRISGSNADQVIKEIGFSDSYCIDPVGFTGGIWLLWCKDDVEIEINPIASQQIHMAVRFPSEPRDSMLYGVDADVESPNWRLYGVDSDSDPLSQPRSPDFVYNPEQLTFPPSSQWISSY
ncbi:hypothetical protein F0562_014451 [Nyssa sinensis]|uniref:CCHC-type domain-containing protein n=1 Tax=Nyssa sinensis TaxID=561372 RepID=A0A5J4ZNH1_9ASTE|nr:hypothetical protein F0562_014451 [Nyssa sinensis]